MNNNIILPLEIVNKILIMRPPHPISKIMNEQIIYYNNFTNNDDYITFYDYKLKYYDLYRNYNIMINKTYDNYLYEILICYGCGYHFTYGDLYFRSCTNNLKMCMDCS